MGYVYRWRRTEPAGTLGSRVSPTGAIRVQVSSMSGRWSTIAGDMEAADRGALDLPETGVCSTHGSVTEGLGTDS